MPRPTKSSMMAAANDHMADQRREADVALDRAIDRVASNLRKDLAANFAHQDVKRGTATPPAQPRVDDLIAVARRIRVLIDTGALRQPEWESLSLESKRTSQQQSIYDQATAALDGRLPRAKVDVNVLQRALDGLQAALPHADRIRDILFPIINEVQAAIANAITDPPCSDDEVAIAHARALYADNSDDDIEIDDDPAISHADIGCWVQGWLWVNYREAGMRQEAEGDDDAE